MKDKSGELIENKIKSATKWSFVGEIVAKVLSPVTSMILARIIAPEAFGVVATVMMIVSFSDIFTEAGFQKYIIQHQFDDEDDAEQSFNVAFWTNLVISILIWFLIYFKADELAILVGNNGKGKVIYIGALLLPLTSFSSIQTGICKKKFDYKSLALARIIVKMVPLLITVPLAFKGYSYWALIMGSLLGELCNVIILFYLSKWRPKFTYDVNKLVRMVEFCWWSLLESLSGWLVANVGVLVIGRLLGEYYTGIYKTALTLVIQITSVISAPVLGVLYSSLSELQDDEKKFEEIYLRFQWFISLIAVPLGFGILIYNDFVRYILLGSAWGEADLLIALSGFVLVESIVFADLPGLIILAKGKPKLLFYSNVLTGICLTISFYFGAKKGFESVVVYSSIARLVMPIIKTKIASNLTFISVKDIFGNIADIIKASLVMFGIGWLITSITDKYFIELLSMIICVFVYFKFIMINDKNRTRVNLLLKQIKRGSVK